MSDFEFQIEAVASQKKLFKALLSLKISEEEKKKLCNLAVLAITESRNRAIHYLTSAKRCKNEQN